VGEHVHTLHIATHLQGMLPKMQELLLHEVVAYITGLIRLLLLPHLTT
jgi:hypothetical protein